MKILDHVDSIRCKAKSYGNYSFVAEKAGVSFHWLQKFAIGRIENPTVENVAKIETFFDEQKNNHTQAQPHALASNESLPGAGVSQ